MRGSSYSNLSSKRKVGRWCPLLQGFPPHSVSLRPRGFRPKTRSRVTLLGPCFKTGCVGECSSGTGTASVEAACSPLSRARPLNEDGVPEEPPAPPAETLRNHPDLFLCPDSSHEEPNQERTNPPQSSLPPVSGSFNPLSRVLFILPSRYFFAIGHSVVFSLGRNLPPA